MEENDDKIKIERILGISVSCNAHLDCDSGLIAYPAGNTVVLLDVGSGTVISNIVLETKKPISSIQLKGNSLLFATSEESNFVRIVNWQSGLIKDISPCQNVICCAVSSALGILVTVGSDRVVSVWDYKGLLAGSSTSSTPTQSGTPNGLGSSSRGRKLASSSVAGKVSCVSFASDGSYFVTGGSRHLKFWYLQLGKNECVLTGRPAILGSEHSNAEFRDVITDGQSTYAIANFEGNSATLCQLCPRRFLDKWVQLKTSQAFCMCMEDDLIFIGCADGIVRCFRAGKLDFVATLPLPHHLGIQIAAAIEVSTLSAHPPGSRFPNVVAIGAPGGKKIVAVYSDHSLYAWDVQDIKRIGLSHSWLWHSGCIWDVIIGRSVNLSAVNDDGTELYNWPTFITCSNDDTIRCWDITSQTKFNLYSNECTDIKYISTQYLDSPLLISHGNGVRCVGIGPSFLCCGDRLGNLRIWGEGTSQVIKVRAHKEEILSVDVKGTLIATGSRDGSVNLYNIGSEIQRMATLQQHSGSVTCVKFIFSERVDPPTFQLVSCGADKNLVLRELLPKKGVADEFSSEKRFLTALRNGVLTADNIDVQVTSIVTSKTPLFDLETDANGKHVLVACQDACARVYNITNGKHSKTLRNSSSAPTAGLPSFIKLACDPTHAYVAAAATDKVITVFDYHKGDVVATLLGHSELATALRFTPDFQNIFSVGGDSCIFVWALPREMVVIMKTRMNEKKSRQPPTPPPKPVMPNSASPVRQPTDYNFSFGQLPSWAKKQMGGEKTPQNVGSPKKPSVTLPQGKWSERVEKSSGALTIKSFHNSDTIVPMPFTKPQSTPQISSVQISPATPTDEPRKLEQGKRTVVTLNNSPRDNSLLSISKSAGPTDEEELQSSDFYSDINKSTDGELSDRHKSYHSESDTDESVSFRTSSRSSAPSKRLIDSLRDSKSSGTPYEILRSRNADLIMSVKAKNQEISKSRLELEKRLESTRKKLQSIGYKSMSQSTQNLHMGYENGALNLNARFSGLGTGLGLGLGLPSRNIGISPFLPLFRRNLNNNANAQAKSPRPTALGIGFNANAAAINAYQQPKLVQTVLPSKFATAFTPPPRPIIDHDSEDHTEPEGMRRACSLSDLNLIPPIVVGTPIRPHAPSRKRSFNKHRKSKPSPGFDPQNIITRSTSMSALTVSQQSDSEPESLPAQPSYMSKTIAFQGKSRRKTPAAYSQENLRLDDDDYVQKPLGAKASGPLMRSKMTGPTIKKPQQIHGVSKGLAVVTGVRQGGREETALTAELASSSVEILRKSLDHVISLKERASFDPSVDQESISRILDDGLRSVQSLLNESLTYQQEAVHKIISDHEPTVL